MGKNNELDQLFKEWSRSLDLPVDAAQFSRDGIINEGRFEAAKHTVLFVLRETNRFPNCDLRSFLEGNLKYQTWHAVARWAYGTLNAFKPADTEKLHDALRQVAVMNLKKITGGPSIRPPDDVMFEDAVRRDREFIRREVTIIDPQVIVSCGERQNLAWILNLGSLAREDRLPVSVCEFNGRKRVFLFSGHPTRAKNESSYAILKKCWMAIEAERILDR